MNELQKLRLLNVARALRESPEPEEFTMRCFKTPCGTPACALGHYAARSDLQDVFDWKATQGGTIIGKNGEPLYFTRDRAFWADYFGTDSEQTDALFGSQGCGYAKTPLAAARYIEGFVKEHYP